LTEKVQFSGKDRRARATIEDDRRGESTGQNSSKVLSKCEIGIFVCGIFEKSVMEGMKKVVGKIWSRLNDTKMTL